jgi:hypothetical protein
LLCRLSYVGGKTCQRAKGIIPEALPHGKVKS